MARDEVGRHLAAQVRQARNRFDHASVMHEMTGTRLELAQLEYELAQRQLDDHEATDGV